MFVLLSRKTNYGFYMFTVWKHIEGGNLGDFVAVGGEGKEVGF